MLNSIQFTLPMPKNNQTMPQPYDPVPPYDLDDVEANAASTHSTANLFTPSQTNADDDGANSTTYDAQHESGRGSNIIDPTQDRSDENARHRTRGGREGKLTERECCDYAFLYFKTVVLGVVMMTFFIGLFAYLGRKKGD